MRKSESSPLRSRFKGLTEGTAAPASGSVEGSHTLDAWLAVPVHLTQLANEVAERPLRARGGGSAPSRPPLRSRGFAMGWGGTGPGLAPSSQRGHRPVLQAGPAEPRRSSWVKILTSCTFGKRMHLQPYLKEVFLTVVENKAQMQLLKLKHHQQKLLTQVLPVNRLYFFPFKIWFKMTLQQNRGEAPLGLHRAGQTSLTPNSWGLTAGLSVVCSCPFWKQKEADANCLLKEEILLSQGLDGSRPAENRPTPFFSANKSGLHFSQP